LLQRTCTSRRLTVVPSSLRSRRLPSSNLCINQTKNIEWAFPRALVKMRCTAIEK
jgi:hypothetical protein